MADRLTIVQEHCQLAVELWWSMVDNKAAKRKRALLANFRPLVETCLKGLWYGRVATLEQVETEALSNETDLMKLAKQIDKSAPAAARILERMLKVRGSDSKPLISVLHATCHSDVGRIRLYRHYELDDVMNTSHTLIDTLNSVLFALGDIEFHINNMRASSGVEPSAADIQRIKELALN